MTKKTIIASFWGLLFLAGILFSSSCKKEKFLEDSGASLAFSEDTVKFDTIFTTVGSSTEIFTVFNHNNLPVKTSIYLADGKYFRLNVNGLPGKSFNDVEIGANDSIFIFVEVTLDPSNINTPMLVTDSILFSTNGHLQDVDLIAYGQDAYFHPSKYDLQARNSPIFILQDSSFGVNKNITWRNDKPHVIYGYMVIDSGYTLTVEAGANIHFHTKSGMIVLSGGKFITNGTLQNPVTIQGDRLGEPFKDIPGQWDYIQLSNLTHNNLFNGGKEQGPGAKDNVLNYTIIKNGYVGLLVDSTNGAASSLILNNCILKNFASTALAGRTSKIGAYNSIFANSGEYCTALLYGGDYEFLHCTIVNFWGEGNRTTESVAMQNYTSVAVRPLNAYFGNCIVYGRLDNEIGLDSAKVSGAFNYKFDHCLLKVDSKFSTSTAFHFKSILRSDGNNNNPYFKDTDNNNYQLESGSPAINYGDVAITDLNKSILSFDLKGDVRPQGTNPDLGAYEMK